MRASWHWRLLGLHLGVTALATAGVAVVGRRQLFQQHLHSQSQRLQTAAIAAVAGRAKPDAPQDICRQLAEQIGVRATWFDASGRMVCDSTGDVESSSRPTTDEEVLSALHGRPESSARPARSGRVWVWAAAPIREQGRVIAVLRVAAPLSPAPAPSPVVWTALLVLAGLGAPLVLVGALRLSRRLSHMFAVTRRAAEGDLSVRIADRQRDELGRAAAGIDAMIAQLAERVDDLRDERTRLVTTLAVLKTGVIIADAEGRLVLANTAAADMLGLELSSALGKPLIAGALHYDLDAALLECISSGSTVERSLLVGEERHRAVEVSIAPVHSESGGVVMAVGALHDVSEQLRVAEIRRDFVANASHELRTPIAAIRAMVETLLAGGRDDPERLDRTLRRVLADAERLSRLLSDLLDLARLERGETGRQQAMALAAPVRRVVERFRQASAEHELQLEVVLDDAVAVQSAPDHIEQVTANLIENAIAYTPAGGTVKVTVAREGDHGLLVVADTGIGIESSHLPRIFERFYRVDSARSRATGGTGLGLSIVRHLVEADGGSIEVESRSGMGATFTVRYPCSTSAIETP